MREILRVIIFATLLPTSLLATEASRELRSAQPRFATVTLSSSIYPETLAPLQYMSGNLSCATTPKTAPGSEYCPTFAVQFKSAEGLAVPPEVASVLARGPATSPNPNFWIDESGQLHLRVGEAVYQRSIAFLFSPGSRVRKQWSARSKEAEVLFVATEVCGSGQGCRAGLWVFTTPASSEARSQFRYYTPALIPLLNTLDWAKLENDSQMGLFQAGEEFLVALPFVSGSAQVVWQVRFGGGGEIFVAAYPAAPRQAGE